MQKSTSIPSATVVPARVGITALVLGIALLLATPTLAAKRVAFLVGNADYAHAPALENPVRDTALIAETLTGLGFEVTTRLNLTRAAIGADLAAFLRDTADADVTLFYFAGHGMQYDGTNYLIGTDARLQTEFDVEAEALSLDRVIAQIERNSRAALIFIDACRDNPLANAFYTSNFSETRALASRGLVPFTGAHQGSMITFSASPGQVAYDGEGAHSPFAAALARHLPTENLEVLSLMKRVIRDVKIATGDLQTPMVTNDLTAEIYLKLGEGGTGATLALQQEQALFAAASDLNSLRAWDVFLQRHPTGTMRDMALAARETLQVAEIASDAGVEVAELTPANITRDAAAGIEADLGLSTQDNRAVQAALNALGYDAGPEDGVMGRRTRQALGSYQLAVGLPLTGVVTQGTAENLGLSLARTETTDRPVVSSRDARRYDPKKLALIESDPRLLRAAEELRDYDIVYGFYDGRVYIGVQVWRSMAWPEAVAFANRAGGHLATLTSREENSFVLDLVKYDDRFWSVNPGRGDGIVVAATGGPSFGLFQPEGAREPRGGWTWVTGEPYDFTDWIEGQPNNWDGIEDFASFQSNGHMAGNIGTPDQGWRDRAGWDDLPTTRQSLIIEIE